MSSFTRMVSGTDILSSIRGFAAFVARETGPYKHPRKIEFVASLEPVKTISGKIRRKNLRLAEYGRAQRSVRGAEYDVTPLRGG